MAELASKTIKIDSEDIKLTPTFGLINDRAVAVLKDNIERAFGEVDFFLGRWVDDAYRRIALPQVMGTVEGALTTEQVARNLAAELRRNGITGFVDRRGRRWRLDTYTIMVARTTTMEAHLIGSARRIAELGQDLVKVSTHLTDCPLCRPFEGMVLSLTGATEGYTTIAEARELGLFHPNCKHGFALYAEALLGEEAAKEEIKIDEDLEELKKRVNPLLNDLVDEGYIRKDFGEFRKQIIEKFDELSRAAQNARSRRDPEVLRLTDEIVRAVKERYGIDLIIEKPRVVLNTPKLEEIVDGFFSGVEYFKNSVFFEMAKKQGRLPLIKITPDVPEGAIAHYNRVHHFLGFNFLQLKRTGDIFLNYREHAHWCLWRFFKADESYQNLINRGSYFISSFSVFLHEVGHAVFFARDLDPFKITFLKGLVGDIYEVPFKSFLKTHGQRSSWAEYIARHGKELQKAINYELIGHRYWASRYAAWTFAGAEYPSTILESLGFYVLGGRKLNTRKLPLLVFDSAVYWMSDNKLRVLTKQEQKRIIKSLTPDELAEAINAFAEDIPMSDGAYGFVYLALRLADEAGILKQTLKQYKEKYPETYRSLVRSKEQYIERGRRGPEYLADTEKCAYGFILAIEDLLKKINWEW